MIRRRLIAGLALLAGLIALTLAVSLQVIFREGFWWNYLLGAVGLVLLLGHAFQHRKALRELFQGRRGDIALTAIAVVVIYAGLAHLSNRHTVRIDMTASGAHSLSPQTETMLTRLAVPVEVHFFHDPLMRKTVELYEMMANRSDQLRVTFYDPTLNPAQARLFGVQFAGTAVMESEGRRLLVNGQTEADIANGLLRVSQSASQEVCFLDGHGEADPFSLEAHDHVEGAPGKDGHSHGLGAQYVMHERHGLAKARNSLETLNYTARRVTATAGAQVLQGCAALIVAGPKTALLPVEVAAISDYLVHGGNGLFMLEPGVETGLEPVLAQYGILVDNNVVIDTANHFWADPSAPAVTNYNRHQITRELPLTFFPGVRSFSPTKARAPGTAVIPLINSSTNSYGETSLIQAAFQKGEDQEGPLTLMVAASRRPATDNELARDEAGGLQVIRDGAGASEVKARSRIAVIGDADFATNSFFHILGNGDLFLNTVHYLAAQENLIGIEPRTYDLPRLNVTSRQLKATFMLSVMLIPALLALIGTIVWWRQR